MIASLPMYARAETRAAHDAFWALVRDGLRARGIAAPDALDWEAGLMEAWTAPDLVLSHTCNYPFRAQLIGRVTLVGASDYGLPGAGPGGYYSVFVARADDPRAAAREFGGAVLARNGADSQSGWVAPQLWAEAAGIAWGSILDTGAHAESARAVAGGRAEIAALDAVSWAVLTAHDPVAARLKVVGRTAETPGISFITRRGEDPVPYRAAIREALAALAPGDAATLMLKDVVAIPEATYAALPVPKALNA